MGKGAAVVVCFTILSCFISSSGAQVLSIWDGTVGDWEDPGRWSSLTSPDNGNGGNIFTAQIDAGEVTLNTPVTIEALNLNAATLNLGAQTLTLLDVNQTRINGGQLNIAGGALAASSGVFIDINTTATGFGSITGPVWNEGTITATGDLVLGDASDSQGYFQKGTLNVGPHHVTLLSSQRASVSDFGGTIGRINIDGGTLSVPNGLEIGGRVYASGVIEGPVLIRGLNDGLLFATGDLTLGDPTSTVGLSGIGPLSVGSYNVTLLDADLVEINTLSITGGTVTALNGMEARGISGYGIVNSPVLKDAIIAATNGTLTINGTGMQAIDVKSTGELILDADATTRTVKSEAGGVLDIGTHTLQVNDQFGGGSKPKGTTRLGGGTYSNQGKTVIGTLIGFGTFDTAVASETLGSQIIAQGPLTLGTVLRSDGYRFKGTLDVGSSAVTLLDLDVAEQMHHVTIAGGSLISPTGLVVGDGLVGRDVTGFGSLLGTFENGSQGRVNVVGGDMTIGDPLSPNGVVINGWLNGGSGVTLLLDSDGVDLGVRTFLSGGTIDAPSGMTFDPDGEFRGFGTLIASQITGGTIFVEGGDLSLMSDQVTTPINLPAGTTLTLLSDMILGNGVNRVTLNGSLDVGTHALSFPAGSSIKVDEGVTLAGGSIQNSQTIELAGVATLRGHGTITSPRVFGDGTVSAEGGTLVLETPLLTSRLSSTIDGTIVLTQDTQLGRTITPPQISLEGPLIVGPYNVILRDFTGVELGTLTEIGGGSLTGASNLPLSLSLESGEVIRGFGRITGQISGGRVEVVGGTMEINMSQFSVLSSGSVAADGVLQLNVGNSRDFGSSADGTQWVNDGLIDVVGAGTPRFNGFITNNGTIRAIGGSNIDLRGDLINLGTIEIDGGSLIFAGGTLISPTGAATVTNGSIQVTGGEVETGLLLDIASTNTTIQVTGGSLINNGRQIDVSVNSIWTLAGGEVRGGSIVSSGGTWVVGNDPNEMIRLVGVHLQANTRIMQGKLVLDGNWLISGQVDVDGELVLSNPPAPGSLPMSRIDATGGAVTITGTMDMLGQALDVTGNGAWALMNGSMIDGRIVTGADRTFLFTQPDTVPNTNELHSITLAGGTFEASDNTRNIIPTGSRTDVFGGLSLDGATLLLRAPSTSRPVQMHLADNPALPSGQAQMIDGVGEIRFSSVALGVGQPLRRAELISDGSLTIGPGITIVADWPGEINVNGRINVQGDIRVGSGVILWYDVLGTWTNTGTLRLEGGALRSQGAGLTAFNNQAGGRIEGAGEIELLFAEVTNAGTVAPGLSAGRLVWDGSFSQAATGLLEIELGGRIAGTEYDLLVIARDATLGGTLDVRLINGLVPVLGDMFQFLSAGSITGSFDNMILPDLGGLLAWQINNSGTALSLEVIAAQLAGDLDGDGFVGITDLNIILPAWNTGVTPGDLSAGDTNGDGFIGIEDLNAVLGNWNNGTLPPAGALKVVPEPGSVVLLLLGGVSRLRRCSRV